MTTPIGSGKNARYGYEEDEPFCGEESLTCSNESLPSQELICLDAGAALAAPPNAVDKEAEPCDVLPDYVALSGSASLIFQATASITVDRYGRVYTAGGPGGGTPGVGGSMMGGYLRDPDHLCEPPSQEVLGNFLEGGAVSYGGGAGIGVGATKSSDMWAVEVGVTTPQLGASYTVGGRHPNWEKSDDK
jgi:hypothetical protein